MNEQCLTDLLKRALWGDRFPLPQQVDADIYDELRSHKIEALAGPVLMELNLPQDLFRDWQKAVVRHFMHYNRYVNAQAHLPISVPYVVLKGTAVAKYYPVPEYRAMGDIDIMTRHEDWDAACEELTRRGFAEEAYPENKEKARHREFSNGDIEVEVHSFYAFRNEMKETELLDSLIIDHITDTHELPDVINGLTLIEHVNHHMESGLGLRQIIDWMMFVDKCLPDEKWPEFRDLARQTGHERLAIVTTRMCELYLGLPERKWCAGAEEAVCRQLMDYVLTCGNFGMKMSDEEIASTRLLTTTRSLKGTMRLLRKRGVFRWKAAQRHRFLRSFAWLYQLGHYVKEGFGRDHAFRRLRNELAEGRQRDKLFEAVGAAREMNGIAYYHNGTYHKTKP